MGVCKVDQNCFGCRLFHTKHKGRGKCDAYGRGVIYTQYCKDCICKKCLVKIMCKVPCKNFKDQLYNNFQEIKLEQKYIRNKINDR